MFRSIKNIINYIFQRVYVNETIILFELKKLKKQNSIAIVKNATFENLNDILSFQDLKFIKVFENFLKIGDTGYLGYIEKECVHRSWVQSNNQTVDLPLSIPYKLKDNEIFIHYCETSHKARGKNIYPHVLCHIAEEFKEKKILITTTKNNIASIKGMRKVGFVPRETIHIFILLGFKFKRDLYNDK